MISRNSSYSKFSQPASSLRSKHLNCIWSVRLADDRYGEPLFAPVRPKAVVSTTGRSGRNACIPAPVGDRFVEQEDRIWKRLTFGLVCKWVANVPLGWASTFRPPLGWPLDHMRLVRLKPNVLENGVVSTSRPFDWGVLLLDFDWMWGFSAWAVLESWKWFALRSFSSANGLKVCSLLGNWVGGIRGVDLAFGNDGLVRWFVWYK